MSTIKSVVVIYNPNSTGSAQTDAAKFCQKLRDAGMPAKPVATKRAGHAKTLAGEFAERPTPTMIVSASGDGGYNEVINGVMKSSNPHAVTGVLPSGNANDHYHFLHRGNTIRRILKKDVQKIDVLKLTADNQVRYAHSYIGLGMTPQIGEELTKHDLNMFVEAWLVIKNMFRLRPVRIRINGKTKGYDHLVFANTARMSKFLSFTSPGTIDDGKFEVISVKSGSLTKLLTHLFKAAATSTDAQASTDRFSFQCLHDTKIQLDGEVINCQKGSTVTIESQRQALSTIV